MGQAYRRHTLAEPRSASAGAAHTRSKHPEDANRFGLEQVLPRVQLVGRAPCCRVTRGALVAPADAATAVQANQGDTALLWPRAEGGGREAGGRQKGEEGTVC